MTLPPLKTLLSKAQNRSPVSKLPARFTVAKIKIEVGWPIPPFSYKQKGLKCLEVRALIDPLKLFAIHRRVCLDGSFSEYGEASDCIDITYIPSGRRFSSITPFDCQYSYPKMLRWGKLFSQEFQADQRLQALLALPQRRFQRLALTIARDRAAAKQRAEFEEWMSQPLSEAEREILDAELDRLYSPRT